MRRTPGHARPHVYRQPSRGTLGGMTTAPLAREMRRCRRALERSLAVSDRAHTLLTVPADKVDRSWLAGEAVRPAVDVELWALHVRYGR